MLNINLMSRTPVYEQIIEQIQHFIISGVLKSGDKLPSVRNLSVQLSINPNTIQKAYSELERRSIICSVPGKGSFVSENAINIIQNMKRNQFSDLITLLNDLALAGIDKEEILTCVEQVYEKY